jgi:hypothetical protein
MMTPLTGNQRKYIEVLFTNRFTDERDRATLKVHLQWMGGERIEDLDVREASALITDLIDREVKYEFVCGRTEPLERRRAHALNQSGDLEARMHHCPAGVDPNHCEAFRMHEERLMAEDE